MPADFHQAQMAIVRALGETVGVRYYTDNVVKSLGHLIHARKSDPNLLEVSFLNMQHLDQVWIVKTEFMKGKKFNYAAARLALREAKKEENAHSLVPRSGGSDRDPVPE